MRGTTRPSTNSMCPIHNVPTGRAETSNGEVASTHQAIQQPDKVHERRELLREPNLAFSTGRRSSRQSSKVSQATLATGTLIMEGGGEHTDRGTHLTARTARLARIVKPTPTGAQRTCPNCPRRSTVSPCFHYLKRAAATSVRCRRPHQQDSPHPPPYPGTLWCHLAPAKRGGPPPSAGCCRRFQRIRLANFPPRVALAVSLAEVGSRSACGCYAERFVPLAPGESAKFA